MNHESLARLKRQAKRLHITHDVIAEAAGVGRTCVVKVLGGQGKSANVLRVTRHLIAESKKNGSTTTATTTDKRAAL